MAGVSAFADVTNNGPRGNINPNQFPISSVATDPSDPTGKTAHLTVRGFTGGTGHVWKTTNAGGAWTDITGNLPDSPVNAVVVYPALSQVYVATDVGVFSSSTSAANWRELGPVPNATSSGFLPNVTVTALGVFASSGQQLLRASTYGRGMWEFDLASKPDFQISVSDSPQTISAGGTATPLPVAALDGFSGTVTLSCTASITTPPSNCSSPQSPLTPGISTAFTVIAGGAADDYYFNVQGGGSDANHTTHLAGAELHILSGAPDFGLRPDLFPT